MLSNAARRRLTNAARMLIYTSLDIIDIALECGNSSRQSFTDAFTKAYKCSPAKYRRNRQFYPIRIENDYGKEPISMPQRPSMTSLISAFACAYHYENEQKPIFSDSKARDLFTDKEYTSIAANWEQGKGFFSAADLSEVVNTHLAPTPICRSAYSEQSIETAVRVGTKQIVIIGSGLDTFAYRNTFPHDIKIFELDHASTLEDKRNRIQRAGWSVPQNLRMIPIDLSKDSLNTSLLAEGFDSSVKSFLSWLGVSYYLSRESIESILRSIAEVASEGSSLVFDYADDRLFTAEEDRVRKMFSLAIAAGEPMKSCFSCKDLESILARHGFLICEHLMPEAIDHSIISGKCSIRAFEHIRYVLAVKKP